jgi:hypothetical protein
MKGIKPINSKVSKNNATRRLNLEDAQFQVGDALSSPRLIPEYPDLVSTRKINKVNPDGSMSARGRNGYNNASAGSMKNGRRTDRSLKFGKSVPPQKENDPRKLSYIKPWMIANQEGKERYMGEVSVNDQP